MVKTDLTNVLVSVFKISMSLTCIIYIKYMDHLGEIQFSFPFPAFLGTNLTSRI